MREASVFLFNSLVVVNLGGGGSGGSSGLSPARMVGGCIPHSCFPHAEVSLGKTLTPKVAPLESRFG